MEPSEPSPVILTVPAVSVPPIEAFPLKDDNPAPESETSVPLFNVRRPAFDTVPSDVLDSAKEAVAPVPTERVEPERIEPATERVPALTVVPPE
jgi:hypothetical protein